MTIKQAVSWLSQPGILAMIHDPTTKKAVQVAIKALSATDTNVGTKLGTNLAEAGTDCITRQAAIDIIEDFPHGDVWNVESMEEMVDRIKQLPPAQPEPKRGSWIKPHGMMPPEYCGVYRCSECDEFAMRDWKRHKQMLTKFCPNCGADMRGEHDG